MKAAYELTLIFLRLWLLGLIFIAFFSVSDFVFRHPHGFMTLSRRLGFAFIWPIALLSRKGRQSLIGKFEGI